MKSTPFLIKPDKTGHTLKRIAADKNLFPETWLQELLHAHPHILPVDEIESVFWPLAPIGREISTNVGYIDNLFISKAGYLVVVETKLWRNPEAKREVLAQAIDYAGQIAKWSFEQLDKEARKYNHKGVIELIQKAFDTDQEELPTEEVIAQNLRLGRFLILVVSDHIRNSLVEMLNYVNRYPHLAANVGLVELQCYHLPGSPEDIIVVPSIVARTVIVERSIVQVNLVPPVNFQLSMEQIKSKPEEDGGRALSEEAFWQLLKQKSPASIVPTKKILDHFGQYPEIILKLRKTAKVARMNLPDTDQRLSLFYINTDGTLTCWWVTLLGQLDNAGLNRDVGDEYLTELKKLLLHGSSKLSISYPITKVDTDAFITVVDRFIEKVLQVEEPIES